PAVQDELARIAVRHDLLVYSDEIYDRLAYGTYHHRANSSLPGMRERTILMGGFSKAYAMTGWRVGWLAAPSGILEGIVKVHQYGIMSAPTVAQDAALEALRNGEADVVRMLGEYDRRRRLLVDGLNALGLDTFEPRGAFYAFPRITSTGLDDEAFTERLLEEERVAVVPGSAFGPSGRAHVRMCYATSYERLVEALSRIGRFVERTRARATAG
ncbi:MAG TPA: aminotransferase class I/II-fold pyridoxal phosphate-dependent enzyme, partial [Candidatus Dormibacteraeota bacterium]|nr:aminotransferase class I/II-fold pyridoxal phosphate-dependent enzyme [Candidatus Dormibacteraeota bacterium]